MEFKKILLAFDGSPLSVRGLELGMELAQTFSAEIGVVTVIDPRDAITNVGGIRSEDLLKEMRLQAQHKLDEARAKAGPSHLAFDFLREGEPVSEIVGAAKEWGAELLILGSHPHSRLARLLYGSTAAGVMERAPCPVLIIPRPSVHASG